MDGLDGLLEAGSGSLTGERTQEIQVKSIKWTTMNTQLEEKRMRKT